MMAYRSSEKRFEFSKECGFTAKPFKADVSPLALEWLLHIKAGECAFSNAEA
jgi:hypothetical protein